MSTDANAYSTAVADAIAPAGFNAFTHFFAPRQAVIDVRSYEQIKADEHREDMRRRMVATRTKERATRVNPETSIGFTNQADIDKSRVIQGSSYMYRTAA